MSHKSAKHRRRPLRKRAFFKLKLARLGRPWSINKWRASHQAPLALDPLKLLTQLIYHHN